MNKIRLYRNTIIITLLDIFAVVLAFFAAYLVRFDFIISNGQFKQVLSLLPLVIIVKFFLFYKFDLYRGMWRFTGIKDVQNIFLASLASFCLIAGLIFVYNGFSGFSRSVFIIDLCFTILGISGIRLFVRMFYEYYGVEGYRNNNDGVVPKRLLVLGAGSMGEKAFRLVRDSVGKKYEVVGFLDDHPVKKGKLIHGVKVHGKISDIKMIAERIGAEEALIAITTARSEQMRNIIEHCKKSGLPFKTLPGPDEIVDGNYTIGSIREVSYCDLLGREDVKLDDAKIKQYIKDRVVLVTGAGGSIGSELCRQICKFGPSVILLYERAESPLYEIDLELNSIYKDLKIVPVLADILALSQLDKVFNDYKPEIVFHAAAYKHVPMLEFHSWKAVQNNIIGTHYLVECSTKYEVDRFVFVSTDKAVRPTNVMGATKRVAEILVQNQECCKQYNTKFITVRFGNVVGSAGSVLPLFKKQIEKGGPVTVTHPEVARFFMTIPEASQLILQAGAMGEGGEIFVLDMGESIKIDNLARDLIRLSGFEPDIDIKITYVGLRPGEKLYEELITEGEGIVRTEHKKIMVLRSCQHNLHILNGNIERLAALAEEQNSELIIAKLKEIVPEYTPARH